MAEAGGVAEEAGVGEGVGVGEELGSGVSCLCAAPFELQAIPAKRAIAPNSIRNRIITGSLSGCLSLLPYLLKRCRSAKSFLFQGWRTHKFSLETPVQTS